jgi:N6-adenosine-specific RNA methylase IME4
MGFWLRNQVEELLVFTRGDVAPFRCQLPNIISLQPGEHSEKPEEFRRLIEDCTGKFSRRACIELFARKQVMGWTGIGHVATGRDIRDDLRRLAMMNAEAEALREIG